jgi:drug/metabolite transporter (DMT)-like permease
VETFFDFAIVAIDVDFHVFANSDAPYLRHSQMSHRVADGVSLRIEHRFLRFYDHVDSHVSHASAKLLANKRNALALPTSGSTRISRVQRVNWRIPAAWLTLCVVWSSTWLAIKVGLRDLPPISFVAIRFVVAIAVLLIVSIGRTRLLPARRSDYVVLAVTGILMFGLNYTSVFWGELYVSSGLAAVLQTTIPIFGMIFAHWMLPDEPLRVQKLAGALLAIGGVALICGRLLDFGGVWAFWGGVGISLGGAAAAFSNVLLKKKAITLAPAMLAAWQMFFGVLPLLLLGFIVDGNPARFHWSGISIFCLLYLAVIGSSLTFLLLYWLLPRMSVTNLQTISLITPPGAVMLGWVLGGEKFPLWSLFGAAVVLIGVWIIFRRTHDQRLAEAEVGIPSTDSSG